MLGYLVVGIVIGPHALALAADLESTRHLAEFGVVFLMFSIGLEFSLPKLYAMKRIVFGFGFAQVASTILVAVVGGYALTRWLPGAFGRPGGAALLALGGALAMSSTAIVVKLLTERIELETEHGRRIVGVLLFQDLAVIPLLIVVPALAVPDGELTQTLLIAFAKAAAVLALLLYFGQKLMRGWFTIVARRRSQELFMLNLLLVTLGLAWITELAGLSLALGAFVAGMLISETEFRHRVEEDIAAVSRRAARSLLHHDRHAAERRGGAVELRVGAGAVRVAAGVEAAADHRARTTLRRESRHLDPHRARPRAGRRVRLRAAEPRGRVEDPRSAAAADRARGDAAVDADGAVPDPVQRTDRVARRVQRVDAAVARTDADREPHDGHARPRDRVRLRAQRPEPGAAARPGKHRVRRARPRSRSRQRRAGRRRVGRLRRRDAARVADGRRRPTRGRAGRDLCRDRRGREGRCTSHTNSRPTCR